MAQSILTNDLVVGLVLFLVATIYAVCVYYALEKRAHIKSIGLFDFTNFKSNTPLSIINLCIYLLVLFSFVTAWVRTPVSLGAVAIIAQAGALIFAFLALLLSQSVLTNIFGNRPKPEGLDGSKLSPEKQLVGSRKNPWLAGLLNMIPGVGYLYVGTRVPFAIMLLMFIPLAVLGTVLDPASYASSSDSSTGWSVMVVIGDIWLAFMVDAYLEAKSHNARLSVG